MSTVIYGLFCPMEGAVRYIGKSSEVKKRFAMHLYTARHRTTHKHKWIAKLLDAGLKPSLVILQEVQEGQSWQEIECQWIAKAMDQGWPLTNLAAGGNGATALNDAARAIRKAKLSDPAIRKKLSDAAKSRWADPEKRKRGQAGLSSDARRKVQSENAKKRATPEYRKMMSEKTKAMWDDPEKRAKIIAGISEETRLKVSAAARRMWAEADDEKKAKMRANLESCQ